MGEVRGYRNVALLLPDGRVFVAEAHRGQVSDEVGKRASAISRRICRRAAAAASGDHRCAGNHSVRRELQMAASDRASNR
jgi:hypothetical protein